MWDYSQPLLIDYSVFNITYPETEVIFLPDDYTYECAKYYSDKDEFLSEILYKIMYEESKEQ